MDIKELRKQIDTIDDQLVELFVRRMQVAQEIGAYKKENHLPTLDPAREEAKLREIAEKVDPEMAQYTVDLYKVLFSLSRDYQNRTTNCECTEVLS